MIRQSLVATTFMSSPKHIAIIAVTMLLAGCNSAPVTKFMPGELTQTSELVEELSGSTAVKEKIRSSLAAADKTIATQENKIAELSGTVAELQIPAAKYEAWRLVVVIGIMGVIFFLGLWLLFARVKAAAQ